MDTSFAVLISLLRKNFVKFSTGELQKIDITYNQLFILLYINKQKEVTQIEISNFLKLDKSQLNRTLNILKEKDLILLEKSNQDKRKTIIKLTQNGNNIVNKSKGLFYEWDDIALKNLSEDERKGIIFIIKKIVKNISEVDK